MRLQARDNPNRVPTLNDGELVQIRAMLRNFGSIAVHCPMARRLLEED